LSSFFVYFSIRPEVSGLLELTFKSCVGLSSLAYREQTAFLNNNFN